MEEEKLIDTNNTQEKVDISERFEVNDLKSPRFEERPLLEELKIGEISVLHYILIHKLILKQSQILPWEED